MTARHSISAKGTISLAAPIPGAAKESKTWAGSSSLIAESLVDRPAFSRLFDASTKTLLSLKNILIDFIPRPPLSWAWTQRAFPPVSSASNSDGKPHKDSTDADGQSNELGVGHANPLLQFEHIHHGKEADTDKLRRKTRDSIKERR